MRLHERPVRERTLVDPRAIQLLVEVLRCFGPLDHVAIDTETTGLDLFSGDYLTGISLCPVQHDDPYSGSSQPLTGFYVPVGHRKGNAPTAAVQRLLRALSETEAAHLFAHWTFDEHALSALPDWTRAGRRTYDVQVHRWLDNENAIKGLKPMGAMYLGEDADAEQRYLKEAMHSPWENQTHAYKAVREAYPELKAAEARTLAREMRRDLSWGDLTVDQIGKYAARDATLTAQIGEFLGLDPNNVSATEEREMAGNRVCVDLTRRGISAEREALVRAGELYRAREKAITDELSAEFGGALVNDGTRRLPDEINPRSPLQMGDLLYGVLGLTPMSWTESGQPSTDKNALEQQAGHPVVARILEARHWSKGVSGFIEPYLFHLDGSADGRIHGQFDTTGTVTGRLKASRPNTMTIPKLDTFPEIHEAFYWTPPGVERVSFDLVSAELWVTASITNDPVLTAILLEGRDMHTETALAVFGRADGRWRTLAKNMVYGRNYGAEAGQLATYAAKAGSSPKEALKLAYKFIDGHKKMYPRQNAVSERLAKLSRERRKLPLHPPGRYRHFFCPGAMPVPAYTALNALVQGGVGEFMKDVMLELTGTEFGAQLILQVHDELVFDTEPGRGPEILATLREITHDINPFRYSLSWSAKTWA